MKRLPTALAAHDPRVDFGTSSPAAIQKLQQFLNTRKRMSLLGYLRLARSSPARFSCR